MREVKDNRGNSLCRVAVVDCTERPVDVSLGIGALQGTPLSISEANQLIDALVGAVFQALRNKQRTESK